MRHPPRRGGIHPGNLSLSAGETLGSLDGIIVPGGFGGRGIEGMIVAVQYAREHHVPFFGICLGMQIAVIEFARHVAGIPDAHSGASSPSSRQTTAEKFACSSISGAS